MLFINDQKFTLEQFVSEIESLTDGKIDLEELKKNTIFVPNDAIAGFDFAKFLRTGKKEPKTGLGSDVLSVFRFYSEKKGGQQVEVRYASRIPHKNLTTGNLIYTPKSLDIDSEEFGFTPSQIEMAMYLYVHPDCKQSPLKKEGSVHKYSHKSLKAEIQAKDNKVKVMEACLNHATNMPDEDVKVMAKGLGVAFDHRYNTEEIRSEIKSYILENPHKYYSAMQTESIKFVGMVQDCIDNGYIKNEVHAGNVVWSYGRGPSAGRQITALSSDVGDPVQGLKDYLIENIAAHYPILINLRKDVIASQKAEDFLKSQKTETVNPEVYESEADFMGLDDVKDFQSASKLLMLTHPENKKSSQTKTSQFLAKVQSGEINNDNVNNVIHEYLAKMD